jgi:hypothetical protein
MQGAGEPRLMRGGWIMPLDELRPGGVCRVAGSRGAGSPPDPDLCQAPSLSASLTHTPPDLVPGDPVTDRARGERRCVCGRMEREKGGVRD